MKAPVMMALVGPDRRIRLLNRSALEMIGRPLEELVGLLGGEALGCIHAHDVEAGCGSGPHCPDCVMRRTVAHTQETREERRRVEAEVVLRTPHGDLTRHLCLSTMPLTKDGEDMVVLCIEDITDIKEGERKLRLANEKIRLVSSITRHDILNVMTSLNGHLYLAGLKSTEPAVKEHISKARRDTDRAEAVLRFSRDYLAVGTADAEWIKLTEACRKGTADLNLGRVTVDTALEGPEVFADPMLERVFHNLVDNSLRHGGVVTHVDLSFHQEAERLVVDYRDDGRGIPEGVDVFAPQSHRPSGHGLQMVREILAITGITIRHVPGPGAQFQIVVPKGRFRLPPDELTGPSGDHAFHDDAPAPSTS